MDTPESDSSVPVASDSVFSVSRPSSASSIHPSDTPKHLPAGAPISSLFQVRHTPTAGRAVFASQDIPEGTLVWRSEDLTLNVLLREYRREVCGQCFGYEYGRDLDIRDKTVGFAFCSKACQDQWREENGEIGVQAWAAVEALVRKRSKEDSDMVDADLPRPKVKEIQQVNDFPAFLRHMDIAPPNPRSFTSFLRSTIQKSHERGYSKPALAQEQALTLRMEREGPDVERK